MKVLILHLSDIHIKEEEEANIILSRVRRIKDVVNEYSYEIPACFIVVSGDIASSGNSREYKIARDFLADLGAQIKKSIGDSVDVKYILVPGNHDCDFATLKAARDSHINNISRNIELLLRDSSVIDECTSVQEGFFKFLSAFDGNAQVLQHEERIYYKWKFSIGSESSYKICFNCYNTAWMSQVDEKQGQIIFPVELIEEDDEKFDLVLSVFHHPYNWLEAENARKFRDHIERTSDVILAGHEHDPRLVKQQKYAGEVKVNEYIEGGVLQEGKSESKFNVIIMDLKEKRLKVVQYGWEGDIYSKENSIDWFPFIRSRFLQKREFRANEEYLSFLNDIGINLTHATKGNLNLDDIFIYPKLEELNLRGDLEGEPYSKLEGENFLDYVTDKKKVMVIGTDKSGKTTLAKKMYVELLNRGIVPILVDGNLVKAGGEEKYLGFVNRTFSKQYDETLVEKYRQLDKDRRAILVDDFGKALLSEKGKARLINTLARFAEIIILFSDELYLAQLKDIVQKDGSNPLLQFKICKVAEFGYLLRERLIRKWLTLGGEELRIDEDTLIRKVSEIERMVDTILGRNLLPRYPIFVLFILQTIEARTPLKAIQGSYGYIYEAFITQSLIQASPEKPDLDIKYTYLSELAYYVFQRKSDELSGSDVEEFNQRYCEKYAISISSASIMTDLVKSQILVESDGVYEFKYKYLYYYFVARYIHNNMQREEDAMRAHIEEMSKAVFREDYGNVIMFLSYLSNDRFLMEEMLRHTREIYKEYNLCDLERDVEFIERTPVRLTEPVLVDRSTEEAREEIQRTKDEVETIVEEDVGDLDMTEAEKAEVSELLKLNLAFKSLEILGQIARNFAGSLTGDEKLPLVEECYCLGLRTLKFLFSSIEDNFDDFRKGVSVFVRSNLEIRDETKLENKTNQFILLLAEALSLAIIKGISCSLGCEELKETYRKVLNQYSYLKSVSLIDISIRLDHFTKLLTRDVDDIEQFYEEIEKRRILPDLLKFIVIERLYMLPPPYNIKQSLIAKLGIRIIKPTPRRLLKASRG